MFKRIFILVTVLTLAASAGIAGARMVIGRGMFRVYLGESKPQVLTTLGPLGPIWTGPVTGYRPQTTSQRTWFYPNRDLSVGFRNQRVVDLFTTDRSERTASGVGVGSSYSYVMQHVPGVLCSYPQRTCTSLVYRNGKTYETFFSLDNSRVINTDLHLYPYVLRCWWVGGVDQGLRCNYHGG